MTPRPTCLQEVSTRKRESEVFANAAFKKAWTVQISRSLDADFHSLIFEHSKNFKVCAHFLYKNPYSKTLEQQKIIPAKGVVQQASFCQYFGGGRLEIWCFLGCSFPETDAAFKKAWAVQISRSLDADFHSLIFEHSKNFKVCAHFLYKNPYSKTLQQQKIIPAKGVVQQASFCQQLS